MYTNFAVRGRRGLGRKLQSARTAVHWIAEDELILQARQQAVAYNPGHGFYNLNIKAASVIAMKAVS